MPDRSESEIRELKQKNLFKAVRSVLGQITIFGALILTVAIFMHRRVSDILVDSGFILVLLATFGTWGYYRWYNYKDGIGPPASDPNDYSGP